MLEHTSGVAYAIVSFEISSAALTEEALEILKSKAGVTEASSSILISGRTDSTGSRRSNQILATARAMAVKRALIELVPSAEPKVTLDARGSCCYLAPNDTESGRSRNRRVQVTFRGGESPS